MSRLRIIALAGITLLFTVHANAQFAESFISLLYPFSVATAGAGEQGVAASDPLSALSFNPANLVYRAGTGLSYYRNPLNLFASFGLHTSMEAANAYVNLGEAGTIGLQYTHLDEGTVRVTTSSNPDGEGTPFTLYERSVAAGYARSFGPEVALGVAARYAWMSYPFDQTPGKLLLSAGISFRPDWWKDRLQFGFSLMNLGTKFVYPPISSTESEFINEASVPAQMNLGTTVRAATRSGLDLDLSLAVSKPIARPVSPPDYTSESSFSALLNGWSNFPDDVTFNWGLSYAWDPIALGNGVSFVEELTLGYFKGGTYSYWPTAYLTHGISLGIQAYDTRITAGYAGRWHNTNYSTFMPWEFPWETFEISVRTLFPSLPAESANADVAPHRLVLTAGGIIPAMTGRFLGSIAQYHTVSFTSKPLWDLELDLYLDERSALVTSIDYTRLTEKDEYSLTIGQTTYSGIAMETGIETFSIESGYRYHPINDVRPLFAQVSFGISRLNPVLEKTSPRYAYKSFDRITIGALFQLESTPIVVLPKVSLKTLWMGTAPDQGTLGGYTQWEFGVNVGVGL